MAKLDIKKGRRFGRLRVIKEIVPKGQGRWFLCKCDCGNKKEVSLAQLRTGKTQSCGCLRRDESRLNATTHRGSKTKLYQVWAKMKARCLSPNSNRYEYYGARGITVCDEWLDFEIFRDWAKSSGYKEGLTIERMDVNGNYCPENCTWIPQSEQTKNSRSNILIEIDGETNILQYWADHFNISRYTVNSRVRRGWNVVDALKTPPGETPS